MSTSVYFPLLVLSAIMTGSRSELVFAPSINFENYTHHTNRDFVSVALGYRTFLRTDGNNPQFDLEDQRFYTLAKTLSPMSVRIGGTFGNFYIFHPADEPYPENISWVVPQHVQDEWEANMDGFSFWGGPVHPYIWENTIYTAWWFERLMEYLNNIHWSLVMGVNQLLRYNDEYDDTNFKLLLNFICEKGYNIEAFHMGNEPNLMHKKFPKLDMPPATVAQDHKKFYELMRSLPCFANTKVIGPEGTSLSRSYTNRVWFQEWMEAGGGYYVDVLSFHHYYLNGKKAVFEDFIDPDLMDSFSRFSETLDSERAKYGLEDTPVWLTETADAYSGGHPDYSRTCLSSFLYMDLLGMCAKGGISKVHRQTFNSGAYALISSEFQPYPDYYIALSHKRLIHGPVLDISVTPYDNHLRIYAHCARQDYYNYHKGAMVIYFGNLFNETVRLNLTDTFTNVPFMDLFIFESSEGPTNITSRHVQLNGQLLEMTQTSRVPDLLPVAALSNEVALPAYSFGFVVVKNARAPACMNRPEEDPDVLTEKDIFKAPKKCNKVKPLFFESESGGMPQRRSPFY